MAAQSGACEPYENKATSIRPPSDTNARRAQRAFVCKRRPSWQSADAAYFNCVDIELKVVLSFVPRPFTTAMMAMEMPAAIRPYSMAVAADSSRRNACSLASITK